MVGRFAALVALLLLGDAAMTVAPQTPATETAASRQASLPRSPRNANYAITARLDPGSRTVTGDEILTWRNTSNAPTSTLRFHLYNTAGRNPGSTWLRERELPTRVDAEPHLLHAARACGSSDGQKAR